MNQMNTLKAIKTEKDYAAALGRMEILFDAKPGSKEGTEAEVLMILISDYERMNYSIDSPTSIEAIKFRMEQLKLKQKDLIKYVGSASRVSEILSGIRPLTLTMIAALHTGIGIPLTSLLQATGKGKKSSGIQSHSQQSKISVAREVQTKYNRKK